MISTDDIRQLLTDVDRQIDMAQRRYRHAEADAHAEPTPLDAARIEYARGQYDALNPVRSRLAALLTEVP